MEIDDQSMAYSHKFSDDASFMNLTAKNGTLKTLKSQETVFRGTAKDVKQITEDEPESSDDDALDELRTYRQSETDARRINPSSSIHLKAAPEINNQAILKNTATGKDAIMSIDSQEFQNLKS